MTRIKPNKLSTFAMFTKIISPSAFNKFSPKHLFKTLSLTGLDELLHDGRTHSVIFSLAVFLPE